MLDPNGDRVSKNHKICPILVIRQNSFLKLNMKNITLCQCIMFSLFFKFLVEKQVIVFRSTGDDPKEALDKALFNQMQALAQRKKEAIKVNVKEWNVTPLI